MKSAFLPHILIASAFIFGGLIIGGCAGAENPAPQAEEEPAPLTKIEAEQIARNHLALKQVTWGNPVEVLEEDDKFYFFYETPQNELRLLGQRALTVNKGTRTPAIMMRR